MSKPIVLSILFFLLFQVSTKSQAFSGINAFKNLIEYEGQRYLMKEIYEISSENIDQLRIEKIIKEVEENEGFMFVMTSYVFNDKSGVVITSFNETYYLFNNKHFFVNVHLSSQELDELDDLFVELNEEFKKNWKINYLQRFSDRIIAEEFMDGVTKYSLWIDNYNRHTLTEPKWKRAIKRHRAFISED